MLLSWQLSAHQHNTHTQHCNVAKLTAVSPSPKHTHSTVMLLSTVMQPHIVYSTVMQPYTVYSRVMQPYTVYSIVMQPHSVCSTVMQLHTVYSTVMQPRIVYSTVMQPHTVYSTVMQPHTVYSTVMQPHTMYSKHKQLLQSCCWKLKVNAPYGADIAHWTVIFVPVTQHFGGHQLYSKKNSWA